MTLTAPNTRGAFWVWILLTILPWLSCAKMSESIEDESVGMNGGFEHTQSGLPVNWLVYSPSTIPTASYELIFDRADFKEGKQSLKFLIHKCSATGGWHSPGITQEYPAIPGESYVISFWIKNEGCEYVVRVGSVDAKTGQYETVDSSKETTGSWKLIEHAFTIPQQYEIIRFELSILSPGSLWIDDVKIEHINEHVATITCSCGGFLAVWPSNP